MNPIYTIELDTQTENKLAQIARLEGKEPVVWIKEKLVNMIQNKGLPTELSGVTQSLESLNKRIGIAKGLFDVPDNIDTDNDVTCSSH